ncbi:M48 family metalloprotease [Candidatus Woesearchaeota archaeon]|nr:M48 family metalloprotease [Candidatus Woesearchaeota archaeon]
MINQNTLFVISSIALTLLFWWLWKRTTKAMLAYAHLASMVFTGFLLARTSYCTLGNQLLSICTWVIAKVLTIGIPVAVVFAIVLGYYLMPWLYKKKYSAFRIKDRRNRLVPEAKIFIADSSKAFAFAIKNDIFISIGLLVLLNKHEKDAVLLHELGHVRRNSSFINFTTNLMHVLSPLARFYTQKMLDFEELSADAFVVSVQKTDKHIESARKKLRNAF